MHHHTKMADNSFEKAIADRMTGACSKQRKAQVDINAPVSRLTSVKPSKSMVTREKKSNAANLLPSETVFVGILGRMKSVALVNARNAICGHSSTLVREPA